MTMRRLETMTFVLFAALAGASFGMTSCGGVAEDVLGTETGNPPELDRLRLRLEVRELGVEVIGMPGAVSPGGARVIVRNLATGEARSVTAEADGSFRVTLAGDLEDGYQVTVSGVFGATASAEVPGAGSTGGTGGSQPIDEGPEGGGSGSGCDAPSILVSSCGQAGCHGRDAGFSAFAADESSALLFVDAPATFACGDVGLIIDSQQPSESLILSKIDGRVPCGSQMPLGATLSPSDIACIATWLGGFQR